MTYLLILCSGILAIEIAYNSSLAKEVKDIIFPIKYITAFKKLKFWNKYLTKWVFPINLAFALFFSIYNKLSEMTNCAYCLSFWLGGVSTYLYGVSPLESILYGLITLFTTHIVEKIYDY